MTWIYNVARLTSLIFGLLALSQAAHAADQVPPLTQALPSHVCPAAAPQGSYYLQGDCTPITLDTCAKPGVSNQFIELLNKQIKFAKPVVRIENSHIRLLNFAISDIDCHIEIVFSDGSRRSGVIGIKNQYSTFNGNNVGSPTQKINWHPDCWSNPGIETDYCPKQQGTVVKHNWTAIGKSDTFYVYIDKNGNGNGVITPDHPFSLITYVMEDYSNAQLNKAIPYLSTVLSMQIDCAAGQVLAPHAAFYEGHMAGGYAAFDESYSSEWQSPQAGTVFSGAIEAMCAGATAQASSTRPPFYRNGQSDRMNFNNWLSQLSGQYAEGAKYFANLYFTTESMMGNCMAHWADNNAWTMGCNEALKQLSVPDLHRRTDPEYRQGWDSNTSPLSP